MADPEERNYSKSAENEAELRNLRSREKHECYCHNSRKLFREHNDVTGIHGMRYLTEKRSRTEKVLWTIIVLTSLAGFIYMMYEILQKYFSSPVVVSFATEDTPIYKIPFPTVTICPEHKYAASKYNYSTLAIGLISIGKWLIEDENLEKFNFISLLCDSGFNYTEELEDTMNKTMDQDRFFATVDEVKPEPNLMFTACSFMGKKIDCNQLFQPIIIDEGVCYSFNILDKAEIFKNHVFHYKDYYTVKNSTNSFNIESGYATGSGIHAYPRRALTSGAENSLTVFLHYNSADTDYTCNSFFQGWRVLIHSPFDVPRASQHYFRVPLDKVIVAAVVPELITTSDDVRAFSPEKRKCFMSDENHLKHFKSYTQSNCILECLTNYTLNKCGCVAFYMPRDNNTSICGIGNVDCMDDAERQLNTESLRKEIDASLPESSLSICDCKPSCAQLQFHIETSHSDFSFQNYFKVASLLSKIKEEGFDEDLEIAENEEETNHWSVLSVYFKSEQFMPIERNQLYGISDLISNLGGLLGLFTGFSLITVAEIIYFLTLRMYCNKKLYGHWSGPPD